MNTFNVITAIVIVVLLLVNIELVSKIEVEPTSCPDCKCGDFTATDYDARFDALEKLINDPDAAFRDFVVDLAKDDLELEDVYDFLVDEEYAIEEEDDIEKFVITREATEVIDRLNGDAEVEFKLRVFYYDGDANEDKVESVYVRFEVEDSEVEDIDFSFDSFGIL